MENIEKLFHTLGNKNRLQILNVLAEKNSPKSFSELKKMFNFNPNTLSFHLAVLEDAKLIQHRVEDGEDGYSFYEITSKGKELLQKYLPK